MSELKLKPLEPAPDWSADLTMLTVVPSGVVITEVDPVEGVVTVWPLTLTLLVLVVSPLVELLLVAVTDMLVALPVPD